MRLPELGWSDWSARPLGVCADLRRRGTGGRLGGLTPATPAASGGGIFGKMRLAFAALLLSSGVVSADPWFLHPFGELRAYHGDWLAVCRDSGAGPCRAVQFRELSKDGFFGEGRLSLHRSPDGWMLGVYDIGMSEGVSLAVSVDGGAPTKLSAVAGEPEVLRVAQSVWAPVPDAVLKDMRRGNRLRVLFPGGSALYSLRGITAATDAIRARTER